MLESFRLPFFASTRILVLFIKMNIKLFVEVRKLFDYQAYMFTNRILVPDLKKMLEKRGHDYSDDNIELSKTSCSKVR